LYGDLWNLGFSVLTSEPMNTLDGWEKENKKQIGTLVKYFTVILSVEL
jgi:hypothetical protein